MAEAKGDQPTFRDVCCTFLLPLGVHEGRVFPSCMFPQRSWLLDKIDRRDRHVSMGHGDLVIGNHKS
jgi:hypothetical protein